MTMIDTSVDRRRFLGRAFLASLVIHGLIAFMIPSLAQVAAPQPVETISFVRITHIATSRPASPRQPSHPAAPKRVAPQIVAAIPKPKRAPAVQPKPHEIKPEVPAFQAAAAPPRKAAVAASISTPATGKPQAAVPLPKATAAPAPVKAAAPSQGTHIVTGFMPFGAAQEPVLDANVHQKLAAIGVHVHLTVLVGDDGRTKHIDYRPPLDATLRARIQALLANASWDAAYCGGGIPCEGTAEIDL
jgi:hypothetical protein